MNYLNKTVCILCHGKSIEELEKQFNDFKDLDVIWAGISTFDIHNYLQKSPRGLSIVYDSGTVKNAREYELKIRIPRLSKFLDSNNENIYICTNSDRNNLYELRNQLGLDFNNKYSKQIVYVENLNINPTPFKVSLHLYIASLCKMGYSKIILFGADGGGNYGNSIESYYKTEEVKIDKEKADNLSYNMVGDTNNINSSFHNLMMTSLGYIPEVLNCSPNSKYSVFKNISYNDCLKYLKNNT